MTTICHMGRKVPMSFGICLTRVFQPFAAGSHAGERSKNRPGPSLVMAPS